MRNKKDLLSLLERISNGKATDKDIEEYNRWCNSFQEKEEFVSNMHEIKVSMWGDIEKQVLHSTKTYRLKMWSVVAAACVILALTTGGYYFLYHRQPEKQIGTSSSDIAPGGSRAVLTLSNGKMIMLDSVYRGRLASQGSSKVLKVDTGLLAYKQVTNDNQSSEIQYNKLSTPRGGQYRLILSDGTKVWLNAASSIRYPTAFTGKERQVTVTGEVYMEVAEDPAHPFIVTTRHSTITVLGTHFNIMAYANEPVVKTTLLEGLVKVSVEGNQNTTIIKPGEQAIIGNASLDIKVKKVDATDVAAWIHGFLSLKECSVQEFMNQLSRWYNVDVEYKGNVPLQKFGGMINRNTSLSDVLSALDAAGIYTKLKGNVIIVSSQKL